jgi:hypothetical protein
LKGSFVELRDGLVDGIEVDVFLLIGEGDVDGVFGEAINASWGTIGVDMDGLDGIREEQGCDAADELEAMVDVGFREGTIES